MTDLLRDLSPEALADILERNRAEKARNKAADKRLDTESHLANAHLMSKLEDGEAVIAPSTGRVVYKTSGALGAAKVNHDAIYELGDRLSEELRPRMEWRYPGVKEVREAAKAGRLPAGIREDDLLEAAPLGSVLRWRTISEEAA